MFKKIAEFSVRWRWFVILFWIAAVPILTVNLPKMNDVSKSSTSDFLPKNSPSSEAATLESAFQRKDTASGATIVVSRDSRPLTEADNVTVQHIITKVKLVKDVTETRNQGVSADGQARQIFVGISGAAFGQGGINIVKNIRAGINQADLAPGLSAHLTGELPAGVDQENTNNKGRSNTELYTVIFILVLLLLVFRAILAPIVTLIPAGLALIVSQPIIAESTKISVQVGFITQILLIVLILGAGTDYGLFLVFRVREEMRNGLEPKDAVVKALSRVGESITFSAATVMAALLSLVLASFGLYKGLGPALAIGLGVMLLIALTFLPALLAILGHAVFWPSRTSKRQQKIGLWGKVADKVVEKPITMLVAGALIFGGLTLGLVGYKSAGFGGQSAPKGSDSALGQEVISRHFPAANNNPQLLIFHFPTSVWKDLGPVAKTEAKLEHSNTFKAVSGPLNANGFVLTPQMLQQLHNNPDAGSALQGVNQFISSDGKTVQFYAVLSAGASGSTAATSAVPAVRSELQKVASKVGADQNQIYSSDSVGYDINHIANRDLLRIIPVVLIIIAVLLALLLRSLVAPWYLILTVGLSYLASLGFTMLVFVHWKHEPGLNFILPFLMFIFCMALGEDYNILVMSRIREEAHSQKSLAKAVSKAIGITGTTVTSAGIILAGTFTVLGLVGGNAQIQQIGFGVAFGVLLDTFFVRTLLVPSIVIVLGRWNWWPSKLSQKR